MRDDAEWQRLCGVMGRDDLRADGSLAGAAGREGATVRRSTRPSGPGRPAPTAPRVAALLQSRGIPAAVAVRGLQLAVDEQLWARDFFRILDRAEVGAHPYPGPVVRLADTPAIIERPAPLYGQHTDQVLRDLLGLGDDELDGTARRRRDIDRAAGSGLEVADGRCADRAAPRSREDGRTTRPVPRRSPRSTSAAG